MFSTRDKIDISVDDGRCILCRSCALACPSRVFSWEGDEIDVHHPGRCIGCGHCVAVCPQEALTHSELPNESFEPVPERLPDAAGTLDGILRSRRSRRRFSGDPLGREVIEELVQATGYSPTSTNSQNVRFIVFEGPERVKKLTEWTSRYYLKLGRQLANPFVRLAISLAVGRKTVNAYRFRMPAIVDMFRATLEGEEDRLFYDAPAVAVIFASGLPHLASASCNLAAMQLLLAADARGIGGCFNGYALTALVRDKKVRQLVGIGKGYTPGAVVALGRTAGKFYRIPPRNKQRIIWWEEE